MNIDFEAEHFIAQCRRDALRYPIRDIGDVAPRRIVSKDFATGVADLDWTDFSSGLPVHEGNYDACLACGGDGGFDDTYIGRDHQARSDYRECRECAGTGRVFHE